MKRHTQLQDLSREHHQALQLALHAKRAANSADGDLIDAAAAHCREAFANELDPHFVVEEDTLLPLLRAAGEDRMVGRVVSDHAQLRQFEFRLRKPDATTLLVFANLLTEHVRFEERELFVTLESLLPDDQSSARGILGS